MLPPLCETSPDIYPAFPIPRLLCSLSTDCLRMLVLFDYLEGSFLFLFVLLESNTVPGTCDISNTSLFQFFWCFPKKQKSNTEGRELSVRFPQSQHSTILSHMVRK